MACPRAWLEPNGCALGAAPRSFDFKSFPDLAQIATSPSCKEVPSLWAMSTIWPRKKKRRRKNECLLQSCSRFYPSPAPIFAFTEGNKRTLRGARMAVQKKVSIGQRLPGAILIFEYSFQMLTCSNRGVFSNRTPLMKSTTPLPCCGSSH